MALAPSQTQIWRAAEFKDELLQGTRHLLPTPTALSLKPGSRPSDAHSLQGDM